MEAFDLSDFFLTKSQANDFATRLSNVIDKIFQTNFSIEDVLTEQFGITKADKFITLLRANNIPKEGNELKEFLSKILENVATLPILSLTIAFDPSEKVLQSISQWCLMNIHTQVLFEITIDTKLIAGAIINYHGKHGDYSIKSKFTDIVKTIVSADVTKSLQQKKTTTSSENQNTEFFTIGR